MARKPENVFIGGVHRQVLKDERATLVHWDKTNNPYTGGIPDMYYDSAGCDLWIEYKWLERVPPEVNLTEGNSPMLSQLQQRWLNRAFTNGRHVWVVVGFRPAGARMAQAVVYNGHHLHWDIPLERDAFLSKALSQADLARYLVSFLLSGGVTHESEPARSRAAADTNFSLSP